MGLPEIVHSDEGFQIKGPVGFATVVALKKHGDEILKKQNDAMIIFNMKEAVSLDSAGLALMIGWKRHAKSLHKTMTYSHVSPSLQRLAQACGVAKLLDLK
jgi:anti-anti-sigma factor